VEIGEEKKKGQHNEFYAQNRPLRQEKHYTKQLISNHSQPGFVWGRY